MKAAPDQAERDQAVAERSRNVLIGAGAGTGKTSTIVRRVVQLVAPDDDGDAMDMRRIAAITFTRKAAGELAQRIRRELSAGLRGKTTPKRAQRLSTALAQIDEAYIGTVHAFADRLLRELADRSGLGPQYDILEDVGELTATTTSILLQAASHDAMLAVLEGTVVAGDEALAEEVTETIRIAQRAGLRAHTREMTWASYVGLDALFEGFCLNRDNPPPRPALVEPDLGALAAAIAELRGEFDALDLEPQESAFGRWLGRYLRQVERALQDGDPAILFGVVSRALDRLKTWAPKKGRDCGGDGAAFALAKRLMGAEPGKKDPPLGEVSYDRENLQGPLAAWLATRLVRTQPVVVALYEKLKAERQAVDQIDLLLQLRNLLRGDLPARERCQSRLDHVFVDEFQDTDPLQAEIVLFLVEDGAKAKAWTDVVPVRGKLTIVGDPKQSIYRFRRADVVMYDRVRRKLQERADDVLAVELTANFRSTPPLIEWLNEHCTNLLGAAPEDGARFDAHTGQVYQQDLVVGRAGKAETGVVVLQIDPQTGIPGKPNVEITRTLCAEACARWIRALIDDPKAVVVDPHTGKPRRPRPGDIAVLTPVTTTLEPVFKELDKFDVPYAVSGGRLFFNDPIHQTFLLALRALAGGRDDDVDDGAALAALYSPPVFGLDLRTLVRARAKPDDAGVHPHPEDRARLQEVEAIVGELRKQRNSRSPGETARALVQRSGLGPTIALRPNGLQRLRRLYELCHVVDQDAKLAGLDFDGVTRVLREALDDPPAVDAPPPLGDNAVSVLTIHQAKGLEFPIVVLWDSTAASEPRIRQPPWHVDREGERWSMSLEGLKFASDGGDDDAEARHLVNELRRLFYVGCTRARDTLVIACSEGGRGKAMHAVLRPGGGEGHAAESVLDPYSALGSEWSVAVEPPPRTIAIDQDDPFVGARDSFEECVVAAARPIARRVPVSVWAHELGGAGGGVVAEVEAEAEAGDGAMLASADSVGVDPVTAKAQRYRRSRYGTDFGNTVHGALDAVLRDGAGVRAAVERCAVEHRLGAKLVAEAEADVERALTALRAEGIVGVEGVVLRPEYPVVGSGEPGEMLVGVIDLIAAGDGVLWILDYKTDQPPEGKVEEELPGYVAQIRGYGEIVVRAGVGGGREFRLGLLFTADGVVRWV